MNTQIHELEQEQRELAKKVTQLADRIAELRKPKPEWKHGDVELAKNGSMWLVTDENATVMLSSDSNGATANMPSEKSTNLGQFQEVFILRSEVEEEYIKKSEVKRICSITDGDRESVLSGRLRECLGFTATMAMRDELAKHGITADEQEKH